MTEGRVCDKYTGPHLKFPLTHDQVLGMMDAMKAGEILHINYFYALIQQASRILSGRSTLQELKLSDQDGARLTIIGDLHGQLEDLLTILTINGLPGKDLIYFFNGDLVDRGDSSCEVLSIILAFLILNPGRVFINRGNHESRSQTAMMGFEDEVRGKYGGKEVSIHDREVGGSGTRVPALLENVYQLFDFIPLAGVIEDRVFIVHGGLFGQSGVTLNHLRAIKRKKEPPVNKSHATFEDKLFEQMLWSDPRDKSGWTPSLRGAGVEFGKDVTHTFCGTNNIALIVRSHECVHEGYDVLHEGRLITLFSASCYCGTQANKGAYISMNSALKPEIQQFYAREMEEIDDFSGKSEDTRCPSRFLKTEQSTKINKDFTNKLEQDILQTIRERICDLKTSLYWFFTNNDKEKSGTVTRIQWVEAMKTLTELDLPFFAYQPKLATLDEKGMINYAVFLERYTIKMLDPSMCQWQALLIQKICQRVYEVFGAESSSQAFQLMDSDKDGDIDYHEFRAALVNLDLGLSEMQIYELMRSADTNNDSKINFEEFKGRFDVVFVQMNEAEDLGEWEKERMIQIGAALGQRGSKLAAAFKTAAKDAQNALTLEQFSLTLLEAKLEGISTKEEAMRIAGIVDHDKSGAIDPEEFASAFKVTDTDSSWQDLILHQLGNILFQHRIQLKNAFRMIDSDGSGVITLDEFRKGLSLLNAVLEFPLTDEQIESLLLALDKNGDGVLSYEEFIRGFQVVDTTNVD
jgi:Ca2+-binding EF-hand superfamily protein/diadenosine tetraphosphatase ApaH/serine/threonine PP2A family protein phosphatase